MEREGLSRASETPGVYVSLDDLMRLRLKARGLHFLPRQSPHSVLAGRHASRMRGRGLDFEEIRDYLPGDDIRSFDWKATARAGRPLVRVFTEERDRPTHLVVDQRQAMFFGTKMALKSVTAAEAAALVAWRVLSVGDRVGATVFGDHDYAEFPARRSQRQVLNILHSVVARNQALHASGAAGAPAMLNRVLGAVAASAHHDYAILIVSDFDGADLDTKRLLTELAAHNTVIAVLVHDPSAREIPERGRIVATDGELQIAVDLARGPARQRLLDASSGRLQQVLEWCHQAGVPVMPLSTAADVTDQVRQLLGKRQRGGAR
jgi:uncharacterized protein (DUF58 family)